MQTSGTEPAGFETRPTFSMAGAFPLVAAELPGWLGVDLLLVVIGVAMIAGVGLWSFREYRKNGADAPELTPMAGGVQQTERPGHTTDSSVIAGGDGGVVHSSATEQEDASRGAMVPAAEIPPRTCPDCERTFPGVFDVCPFDSTTLVDRDDNGAGGSTGRLPRRYCPDCGRRYELNATHCYHDGQKLRRDREKASRGAPTFRVCRECGFECRGDDQTCPRDGESLVALDPMRRQRIRPPFPYNRCRECGYVAGPGETHCPTDGSFLLPELSARLTALPPTGYGPRRQICPDCGAQFADHCNFCSGDGTELIALN